MEFYYILFFAKAIISNYFMMKIIFKDETNTYISMILLCTGYFALYFLTEPHRSTKYRSFEYNYFRDCIFYAIPLVIFGLIFHSTLTILITVIIGGCITILLPLILIVLFD